MTSPSRRPMPVGPGTWPAWTLAGTDRFGRARRAVRVEDWRRKQMFLAMHVRRARLPFVLTIAGAGLLAGIAVVLFQ
jgi:hypothetical protein